MTLHELARLLGAAPPAAPGAELTSATEDSRRVRPGGVFFAIEGEHSDGHAYIAQAVANGAVAVVGARSGVALPSGVPYLTAANPRRALGELVHALAGDPSRAMTVVGVTGTNGKSSTVLALRHVFERSGRRAAAFGTLGYAIGGRTDAAAHTTAFPEELAQRFAEARDAGVSLVAMETSSHALDQERVAGIDFDVAVFTNLTQDHLDYHADMDAYLLAKLKLFERLDGPGRFTVVNADDPAAPAFIAASRVPCHTFGAAGVVRARDVELGLKQTRFTVETPWGAAAIASRLLGAHNVANLLGVIATACGLGLPLDGIAATIADLPCAPGRFEHVEAGQPFQVVVDYAHTEDGLRNVLRASRAICRGRVLVVFGCGGDRDRTKRPLMARAAAELADHAVITSDNPRTEDPQRILDEVEAGMTAAGKRRGADYDVIEDRAAAIAHAIGRAGAGDLVMIAGKGHEDYQILGTERIHFDDREVARAVLAERQTAGGAAP